MLCGRQMLKKPLKLKERDSGAFIFGGMAGVQQTTFENVWVTRLMCAIISTCSPSSLFRSVFMHKNSPECSTCGCA